MRIGIDLRALQIGHQFRGIGEVVRQACRQLDARSPAVDEIVAFVDGDGDRVPEILPELFGSGRRVTIVSLPPATTPIDRVPGVPLVGRALVGKAMRTVEALHPAQAAAMAQGSDVLIQFDVGLGLPEGLPSVAVVYDQVPLLLADRHPHHYHPTYGAARRAGISRLRAANKAWNRELYRRHQTKLFNFILRSVRDADRSQELLQEVFLKLARRGALPSGLREERGYLLRMVHHAVVDTLRRREVRSRAEDEVRADLPVFAASSNPDDQAFRTQLSAALGELPPDQRAVVHLKLWEGLTFERIAMTLEISPNTAASRYRYGLDKLRYRLRPLYDEIQ